MSSLTPRTPISSWELAVPAANRELVVPKPGYSKKKREII